MDDARWERRVAREKSRNAELEKIIEDRSRELYQANERLREHNSALETEVQARTVDLRVALEAAEEASRAKTGFLAQMSHELRTPLHGLGGTIEALTSTHLDIEQRRLIDQCQTSAARLLRVIGDVLDFSRIESGRLEVELSPASVKGIVDAASSSFEAAAAQKGLKLTSEVIADGPTWMLADSHRVGQVLSNLLSNAVKFTKSGQVSIRAEVRQKDCDMLTTWSVSDTGCGMTDEATSCIFEAFKQADAATTRRYGGTGLGLSIVKGLVECMGGEISVRSEVGKGTTFVFTTINKACEPEYHSTASAEVDLDLTGLTLLIVDDHPINRALCESMLADVGCKLLFAENGIEAIMQVAKSSPDLVLMDCHMPGMSGLEATRAMRASGFDKPIVAVSADVTTENASAVIACGMQGIVGKPFRQVDLLNAIADLLKGRSPSVTKYGNEEDSLVPLFSLEAALELVDGQRELVARLCEVFLDDLPKSVEGLVSALQAGDCSTQAELAHSLKGAAGVVCAARMHGLLSELEAAGLAGKSSSEQLPRLEAVAAATESKLRDYLASV